MINLEQIQVRQADWLNEDDQWALKQIRKDVFIKEQQVPEDMEWDDDDEHAIHWLVFGGEKPSPVRVLCQQGKLDAWPY